MPRKTMIYDIVISCPTDVDDERTVIENVVNDFNRTIGINLGINLNIKHWTTDSYAQSGGTAQELLNKQFINESDMIICIFWGRMGTPTENYESGTAEELQEAINAGKQVFLYFSNSPVPPKKLDIEQYKRVRDFEKKIQEEKIAYYKHYNNLDEFKSIITTDLNLFFIQSQQSERDKWNSTNENKSNLGVYGIQNKRITNCIINESVMSIFNSLTENKVNEIIQIIEKIQKIKIEPVSSARDDIEFGIGQIYAQESVSNLFENKQYKFSEIYITTINNFIKDRSIELKDNFFEVGNLSTQKSPFTVSVFGGTNSSFEGSEDEKKKQEYIENLYYEICEYFEWEEYFKQFSDIDFIRLALSNKGTIFESDISVNIKFLKSSYIHFRDISVPKESIIELVNDSDFIEQFFGDINSVEINSYDYILYNSSMSSFSQHDLSGFPYKSSYDSLVDDYFKQQEAFQCYEEYEDGDYIIQKYHFKELKQHTSISFPGPLLFKKNDSDLEIEFEIISKENPEKTEGSITSKTSESIDS